MSLFQSSCYLVRRLPTDVKVVPAKNPGKVTRNPKDPWISNWADDVQNTHVHTHRVDFNVTSQQH